MAKGVRTSMISIAIPTYEMSGRGAEFLNYSLNKIYQQTYKEFEVVVSDNSKDDMVQRVCELWSPHFKIVYLRNNHIGSAPNTNNCLRNCSGELIKILCQDDYLADKFALEKIVREFNNDPKKMWLVGDYIHTTNRNDFAIVQRPVWNDNIKFHNTIGTHSCLTIRNKDLIYFDDNLVWFVDCEFYDRLYKKFGEPIFLRDITVVQFIGNHQVTNTIATEEVKRKEEEYLKGKQ
jgi:glycosyltransferase involved in cell wall biosynthesis